MSEDTKFKQPLSIDEMIKYLADKKRIIYNDICEDEAKKILYEHNYINVITPFKYRFARKDKKGRVKRDANGNHIYDRDIDFKEYYDLYTKERSIYPTLYKNIMQFEVLLNSIVSYESIYTYNLVNMESFKIFLQMLTANINMSCFQENIQTHLSETVKRLSKYIEDYKNPYIVFDNLSINETLNILACLDSNVQEKCINAIVKNQEIIKATDISTFYNQVSKLIRIRNCVCHNDSLEILLRYLSRRYKSLRTSSDKYSYAKLVEKLSR